MPDTTYIVINESGVLKSFYDESEARIHAESAWRPVLFWGTIAELKAASREVRVWPVRDD